MPKVAFCTLGCKVNQYDSQAMLELFEQAGYTPCAFSEPAHVYVVNTCTVTGTGDHKSRQMIRRANRTNPQAAIVVTGCMAQRAAQELLLPGVMLVIGTQRRSKVVTLLEQAMAEKKPIVSVGSLENAPFECLSVSASEGHTRATLKIQEGCRNYCTYCIIPSVRGPIRSRKPDDIRAETERLARAGFSEIVVTGIHLASYGKDFGDGTTLLDALKIIASVEGVRRIRLGSLEPGIVTPEFARELAGIRQICPQFMLALQSGCDTVLRRMGRRYDTARYEAAVQALRSEFDDPAFTSDVMCGFPGETEEEFAQTMAFVEKIGFARIHVFPYSERKGTKAAVMPNPVPVHVREERAGRLIALGERLAAAYAGRRQGKVCEVLFEQPCEQGAEGYTREYIRVAADGTPGETAKVLLEKTDCVPAVGHVIRA